jgi:predicted dehydrogenase
MKVGIVGVGAMGRHHAQVVKNIVFVDDVLGCDVAASARQIAKSEGVKVVEDMTALLSWKPDAVIVATQPTGHAAVIEACIKANVPVLAEKPLATTLKDSRRLVAMAKRKGIPLQVGFELRYCGSHRAMCDVVRSGKIGKPTRMSLIQNSGAHPKGHFTLERCKGIFWEKLCHEVDIFRYWFGEPERIMAIAGPKGLNHYGIPDNAMACMRFPGEKLGTIMFTCTRAAQVGGTDDHGDRGHFLELTLACTNGSVTYDPWTDMLSVVKFNHRKDCKSELLERVAVEDTYAHAQYNIIDQDTDFLTRVRDGKKLQFPAEDALISMEWVAKAEQSISLGGKWIAAS